MKNLHVTSAKGQLLNLSTRNVSLSENSKILVLGTNTLNVSTGKEMSEVKEGRRVPSHARYRQRSTDESVSSLTKQILKYWLKRDKPTRCN